MSRLVLPFAISILLAGSILAADEDVAEKKLTTAKEEYKKAIDKGRAGLLTDLKKAADKAQKAGDLKMLETIEAEAKAFEEKGDLPKAVATKGYESQVRISRAKLEEAYGAAVKQYTKDGKLAVARAVQQELDEFKKAGQATPVADLFQPKSVWINGTGKGKLTVLERTGDTFRARWEYEDRDIREVSGTVKNGKVDWLAKDQRVIKGDVGGDNHGTMNGSKIDFVWRDDRGGSGTFTLRLGKGK